MPKKRFRFYKILSIENTGLEAVSFINREPSFLAVKATSENENVPIEQPTAFVGEPLASQETYSGTTVKDLIEKQALESCDKWLRENNVLGNTTLFSPAYTDGNLFDAIDKIRQSKKYVFKLAVFGIEIEELEMVCPFEIEPISTMFSSEEHKTFSFEKKWNEDMYRYGEIRKKRVDPFINLYKAAVLEKFRHQGEIDKADSEASSDIVLNFIGDSGEEHYDDKMLKLLDDNVKSLKKSILECVSIPNNLMLTQQENLASFLAFLTLPSVESESLLNIALKANGILFDNDTFFENESDVFENDPMFTKLIIAYFKLALTDKYSSEVTNLIDTLNIQKLLNNSFGWQAQGIFKSIVDLMKDVNRIDSRVGSHSKKIEEAFKGYLDGQFKEVHRERQDGYDKAVTDDSFYRTSQGRLSPTKGNSFRSNSTLGVMAMADSGRNTSGFLKIPPAGSYDMNGSQGAMSSEFSDDEECDENFLDLKDSIVLDDPKSDVKTTTELSGVNVRQARNRTVRSLSESEAVEIEGQEEKLVNEKVGKARGVEVVITIAEAILGIDMSFNGLKVPYLFKDYLNDEIDVEVNVKGETVKVSETDNRADEESLSVEIQAWIKLKKSYYMCIKIINDIVSRSKEEEENEKENSNFVFTLEKPKIFSKNPMENAVASIKCAIQMVQNLFKSIERQKKNILKDFDTKIEKALTSENDKSLSNYNGLSSKEIELEKEMFLKADSLLKNWVTGYLLSELVIVNGRNRQRIKKDDN
ncbi:hypothetical protein HOG98_03345 [bacterium]|jgi:hypothetical protein|nr:hypothetical protein [bacterium]